MRTSSAAGCANAGATGPARVETAAIVATAVRSGRRAFAQYFFFKVTLQLFGDSPRRGLLVSEVCLGFRARGQRHIWFTPCFRSWSLALRFDETRAMSLQKELHGRPTVVAISAAIPNEAPTLSRIAADLTHGWASNENILLPTGSMAISPELPTEQGIRRESRRANPHKDHPSFPKTAMVQRVRAAQPRDRPRRDI